MTSPASPASPKKPAKKVGRKANTPGKPMKVALNARIDEMTMRYLHALGRGNASEGLRLAAEYTYDQWQRGRVNLKTEP